uniref:Pecanex-like protein n=1 Tax=Strigamia maritima TaxID=126957 RepID=T1JFN4_STRMM
MPDSESPLVNEFKYDFIRRRLAETILGGPKLAVCTRSTLGIHLSQAVLYTFPLLIGLNLFALARAEVLAEETATYCAGAALLIFTLLVQLLSCQSGLRSSVVVPKTNEKIQINDELSLQTNSCCGNATLQFVVPKKKFKLNIVVHAIVSGVVGGFAFRYLSPSVLERVFPVVWTNYLFCFWGWLVVCNAQYSLTSGAPPEPVVFHPLDGFEAASLMRSFYVFLFSCSHLILSGSQVWCWVKVDWCLHVVFAFLPLLWLMGILPPLDALFPWFGEQLLVYVFGGTAMASDLRLLVCLLMSVMGVTALYFIPSFLYCSILAAVCGYIFSLDLCKLWSYLIGLCKRKVDSDAKYTLGAEQVAKKSKNHLATAFYLFVFVLAASVLVLCHLDHKNRKKEKLVDSYGYILLCLSAFNCVLSSVQQVYIVHGFFVNPIYPTENSQPSAFQRRIKPLNLLGYLRIVLVLSFKKTITLIGDTVYYKQLTPTLIGGLQRSHLLGSLGHVLPGDFFLIHFEDRMIFIVVLEKGFGYCTFGVKGLELQETSCHAVEATHLDMLMTTAFDWDHQSRRNPICMNSEPFHVFHPLATLFLLTYSDTRNVLTGLIDSPDTLKLISTSYVKTLAWVLLRHSANKYVLNEVEEPKKLVVPDVVQQIDAKSKMTVVKINKTLPKQTLTTTAGWSDEDDDPLGDEPSSLTALPSSRPGTNTVLYATHLPGTIDEQRLEFGLPAVDNDDKLFSRKTVIEATESWSNSGQKLAPPYEWMQLPLDKAELGALKEQFSVKWFHCVLKFIARQLKIDEKSSAELEADERLSKAYRDLCLTCHAIVNGLAVKNEREQHLRPTHVFKTFNGEVVWSPQESWLTGNKELYGLAIKAYGYATKLALDQIIMGESSTDEELVEYLMEYDTSWHIGTDASKAWEESVLHEKPNLFSLGFNSIQRTFTSHLLTLQQLAVHVGRLNPEVVRGIWASLAFELLYLTNDDEERFSIQAHPIILRNVIVQAADPPLGYPIFLSGHVSAGIGNLWTTDAQ